MKTSVGNIIACAIVATFGICVFSYAMHNVLPTDQILGAIVGIVGLAIVIVVTLTFLKAVRH